MLLALEERAFNILRQILRKLSIGQSVLFWFDSVGFTQGFFGGIRGNAVLFIVGGNQQFVKLSDNRAIRVP
jgi:hypothetical protein